MGPKMFFAVDDLWFGFTDTKPVDHDWDYSTHPNRWDFLEAVKCDVCGEIVLGVVGEEQHRYIDSDSDCEGYLYAEGPLMNYYYPIDLDRIGGADEAAKQLVDLPLCVVQFYDEDGYDSGDALALTGGGMDLSWEIVEGYVRLGYLPPTHFSRLPEYSGKPLNETAKILIAAMRRALEGEKASAERGLAHLSQLEKSMAKVAIR
jgi:hypothetical protein